MFESRGRCGVHYSAVFLIFESRRADAAAAGKKLSFVLHFDRIVELNGG